MAAVALTELVDYLNEYLDIANVPDYPGATNGLQVESSGSVSRIVACTDACQATIEAAIEHSAELMLVHHGLFWGEGPLPLIDRQYHRIRSLLLHDIAVYSAHLPLDAHPEVGNNVQLAHAIQLNVEGRFGDFEGHPIGVWGTLSIERDELALRLRESLGGEPFVISCGPQRVGRLGIVTGGAASLISQARDAGLDTFITGEGPHHSYFEAEEWGLNVFYAGHYATETLGVKALAQHVSEKFSLAWEFIDHPTGL